MKKYVFLLLFLQSCCLAFGQSVNIIQVFEKNQSGSSYLVSCIDSIMYDLERQLQIIHIDGDTYEHNIQDIDSVSIGKEEVKVYFVPDYIEGTETYLFSNGCVINISKDSLDGYTVVVDSLDFDAGRWDEGKAFAMYCDPMFRPLLVVSDKVRFQFVYDDIVNTFSLRIIDSYGNCTEMCDLFLQDFSAVRSLSRGRASTDGNWIEGAKTALNIVDFAYKVARRDLDGLVELIRPDLIPKGIPEDVTSIISGSIALYFEKIMFNKALGLVGIILDYFQLLSDLRDWVIKQEIGDITPTISYAQAEKGGVVLRIRFTGDGLMFPTRDTPLFQVNYWQEVDGQAILGSYRSTMPQSAYYDFTIEHIANLEGGNWAFQVVVYPSRFGLSDFLVKTYSFRSNIKRISIGRVYIAELEQTNDYYIDNIVTLSMTAKLAYLSDVDKVVLSAYKDYGIYVRRGDKDPVLYSVKENNGMEFVVNFDFTKDELNFDYVSFMATPKEEIKFGVYTVNGYGLKEFFNEEAAEMSYGRMPKALTGDVVSVGKNEAIVNCSFEGCNLWGVLCGVEYGYGNITETGIVVADYDGEHEVHLTDLKPSTTYFYRAYFETAEGRIYDNERTFATNLDRLCPNEMHPHVIDMGLPSGTKWSCCNVGANKPEDAGGLYAWGEVETKGEYGQENYVFCPPDQPYIYEKIGVDIGGTAFDVAAVKWGTPWRMPSLEDINELLLYCETPLLKKHNGAQGVLLTSTKNGSQIFLPCNKFDYYDVPFMMYWTSTYKEKKNDYNQSAYQLVWSNYLAFGILDNGARHDGKGVRPVFKK